ncbi:MAG TPA: class I adenylate-forming enzyme family protein [Burkholderiales bacterium]|nr:class I adenylate-forming enzyme family protein [Burkholderiales bacterium]
MRLDSLLAAAAGRHAGRDALAGERRLSHAAFLDAARGVADALARAGIARDEPVHVRVSNHPLDFVAFFGAWLAGAVVVPVHRASPALAAAQIAGRTQARFEWDALGASPLRQLAEAPPPAREILKDAALVVFTSGSSGAPKGAVLSHRAFAGKLAAIQQRLGFGEDERTMLVLNITFSFGIWVALLTLLHGGCLLPAEKFMPARFLDQLREDAITRVGVVPTMMRALILDHPGAVLARPNALRTVMIGGESLGQSLGEQLRALFAPADLVDIYGLTETSTCDFFLMPQDVPRYSGCIGRPSPGVEYRIRADDGGEVGELCIRSPFLMNGYLGQPELNPVDAEGWLATGDLARERDPGVVEIAGRKKELIVRGGNKITPQEIEFACSAHPKVAAAIAVGRPDARLGQRIHTLVVPRDASLRPAELREFLRERLEKYKQPDVFYFARELPAGRTGKADRGRFTAMLEAGELVPQNEEARP